MTNKQWIYQEISSNFRKLYKSSADSIDEITRELIVFYELGVFYDESVFSFVLEELRRIVVSIYAECIELFSGIKDLCFDFYCGSFGFEKDEDFVSDELYELMGYVNELTNSLRQKSLTPNFYKSRLKNAFFNFGLKSINHHNSLKNGHRDVIYDVNESGEVYEAAARNSLRHFSGFKSSKKIKQLYPPSRFGSHEIIMPNFDTV